MDAVGFLHGKDGDDVGVIKRGYGARFALKTGQAVGIVGGAGGEDFDGNIPAEARVVCAENFAHPSGSDGTADLVVAEFFAWGEEHG